MNFKNLVKELTKLNKTISTMESCTGGSLANEITNIEGASTVLKFSAVTYSNEYKIKMGVDENIINKYSVYSIETAVEMSKNISEFSNSNYGVGITGKLNIQDNKNPEGKNNEVFISIYDKDKNKYFNDSIKVSKNSRKDNKKIVIDKALEMLSNILE